MQRIILVIYVITATAALVTVKLGTASGVPVHLLNNRVNFTANPFIFLGLALYGLSFFTYMYLISKNDLGYIVPFAAAFVYILLFTASYFIFHEVFTATKITGIVLILSGLIFLNLNR